MLKSLFIMAFALFGTIATAGAMDKYGHGDANAAGMKPLAAMDKPVVAVFYADWCGSCKILDPKMKQAVGMMDKDAVDVVMFDLTDEETKAKSAALAGEKGLTDLYNAHAPKTGYAVLVKDGKAAMRITKNDSVEVIKAKLETFAALSKKS